jgi:hypothetical protein
MFFDMGSQFEDPSSLCFDAISEDEKDWGDGNEFHRGTT